ncbi:Protein of unknown function [Legionella hackeliae]|uniref:Uncharacterized protein n=1 Tax=Legionella hackeliae TaxID=449 RepID=A0A0A8USA6_LEGHA|nr:Protein of unknown function [Legionella hackeliae]
MDIRDYCQDFTLYLQSVFMLFVHLSSASACAVYTGLPDTSAIPLL